MIEILSVIRESWLNLLRSIQRSARRKSLIQTTKQANKICLETGKTMLVYFYKGEYRYIAKQDMKKAGMSGKEAEAIAQAKIVRYYGKRKIKGETTNKIISARSKEVAGTNC